MKKIKMIAEGLVVLGFISLGYGIYRIYPPAMFITCGILIMYLGIGAIGGKHESDK